MTDPRIKVFKDISGIVGAVIDMTNLLDVIIVTVTRIMNAKASSLLLVDEKTKRLSFHITTGDKKDEVKRFELKKGEGIAGWVVEHGKPLLVANVKEDPRWSNKISEATGFETHSIACAPLKVGERILGVIEIIDHEDGSPLTDDDLETLNAFSELAAASILKSKMYTSVNKQNVQLRAELEEKFTMIGESQSLINLMSDCSKIAHSNATVLISGESGTGKELTARFIHNSSPRKECPFVVINCAALPDTLLESELFGYAKGAFTGADTNKAGLFEAANQGTLFLDEIGETSPSMQVKLLRVLQEGVFNRLGSLQQVKVDVRILAATNKDIELLVSEKKFREDLYYRLNVVRIKMPSLAERREDIPILANDFLKKIITSALYNAQSFSGEAMSVLKRYHWPGNIRQLKNAVERAVIMGMGKEIAPSDLPYEILEPKANTLEVGLTLKEGQDNFKRDFIKRTLTSVGGNKTKAAAVLDIQRTYLSRLIKELEVRG